MASLGYCYLELIGHWSLVIGHSHDASTPLTQNSEFSSNDELQLKLKLRQI
jgi:hypothetical protein